ncbi:hypothetical protein D5018_04670 [Parashewanella curva]|uniref:Uncharacterized protein n=1 Tax=Parashewanella curva TaxID=2338552 RepID=A0A3L8Q1H9_9GAMM|nr:hypothetical protein [Parashewanella curva]RLV60939.1 hypothetical protein D5018_04670 [Parashewanella curva]
MGLVCSHCHKNMSVAKIEEKRGEGLASQIRCYHCQAWLGKNVRIAQVKMLSFYLLVGLLILGYVVEQFEVMSYMLAAMMGMALIISHFMDQVHTIEAPEQEDVSDQLKKYR